MKQDENDPQRQDVLAGGVRRVLSPAVQAQRQELYKGFGDTLALAFELAVTPVIFGLMGYGLDRWLGTLPILTVVFVVLCIVGLSVRLWYDYDARMRVHEANGPWARRVPPPPAAPGTVITPGTVEAEVTASETAATQIPSTEAPGTEAPGTEAPGTQTAATDASTAEPANLPNVDRKQADR